MVYGLTRAGKSSEAEGVAHSMLLPWETRGVIGMASGRDKVWARESQQTPLAESPAPLEPACQETPDVRQPNVT